MVKKIAKPLAIAVAAYFTAGLALSFIPATSAFAASLPGFAGGGLFGTGIGAGAVAGEGIFSTVAGSIGLGGGLAQGAASAAGGAAAAGAVTTMPSVFNAGAAAGGLGLPTTATVAAGNTAGVISGMGAGAGATAAGASLPVAAVGMSLTDKLLLAKMGTDVAGALFGPSPQEEFEAEAIEGAKFRGAFYGQEAGGPAPPAAAPPQPAPAGQSAVPDMASTSNTITPEQQQLLSGRQTREKFPTAAAPQVGQATGPGAMKQNIPIPENLFAAAPDVRYV